MQEMIICLIDIFGYWGVCFLIAIENIFPPIPSEVILTFSGFLTTYTAMEIPQTVLFATIGSVVGAIVLYAVGYLLSPERLQGLLEGRVGQVLKMEASDVQKAADWFGKRGTPSILYCRCIPILRSLISIPAGMAHVKFMPFLLLTTLGSTVWNILLVSIGALAGKSWPVVTAALEQVTGGVKIVMLVIAAAAVIFYFFKKRKES